MELKTLFHRGRTGAVYAWKVWTENNLIVTEYWQYPDGKRQQSVKEAEIKNLGRSNEVSPEDQAVIEAQALWKFKLDRKYSETPEEALKPRTAPMLAPSKDFSETKKYVKYPCHVQPKLDGNRCLAYWSPVPGEDRIILLSRGQKEFEVLGHIKKQLEDFLPKDGMLDGELYIHGESCQTITSYLKKYRPGITETVQYHVYDMPISDGEEKPWEERFQALNGLFKSSLPAARQNIIQVLTVVANSEYDVYNTQAMFLENGYEGAIIRTLDGQYEWGYRSKSLIKMKNFDDHEYEIVGFENGRGKNETSVTWVCKTSSDKVFRAAQTGVKKDREQMLQDGHLHVGKLLKVKHQGYTEDGIPRFPIGIAIREEWDV
jgi:ATP-dependent DNA ligase